MVLLPISRETHECASTYTYTHLVTEGTQEAVPRKQISRSQPVEVPKGDAASKASSGVQEDRDFFGCS